MDGPVSWLGGLLDGEGLLRIRLAIHFFYYSSLLGMVLYQSFVMTKVSFKALPMTAFTTLQKRVFPVYFQLQAGMTVAVIASYPFGLTEIIITWDGWSCLVALAMALLNMQWYGPLTSKMMSKRIQQGHMEGTNRARDGINEDMKRIKRQFSAAHAMSIHLNLIAVLATLAHGLRIVSILRV